MPFKNSMWKEKLADFLQSVLSFLADKNQKMKEPHITKSTSASPDAKSWYEYIWKTEQETPNRLEDAAKFLATMISVSLTIFLSIGKESFLEFKTSWQIKYAVISWILSLLTSFLVLFPWHYRYASVQVASIKAMHKKVVWTKRILLIISLILFLTALCLLAIVVFVPTT